MRLEAPEVDWPLVAVLEELPELPELPEVLLEELPELPLEAAGVVRAFEALAEAAAALAEDEAWAEAPEPSRLAKAVVSGARELPRWASEWTTLMGSRVGRMLSTCSFLEVRFHWFW